MISLSTTPAHTYCGNNVEPWQSLDSKRTAEREMIMKTDSFLADYHSDLVLFSVSLSLRTKATEARKNLFVLCAVDM